MASAMSFLFQAYPAPKAELSALTLFCFLKGAVFDVCENCHG
jgi:hypothetical protein